MVVRWWVAQLLVVFIYTLLSDPWLPVLC